MGRITTASVNQVLTTFAQGHMNDLASSMEVAERLAPTVVTPGGAGQYKAFDDKNSFQVYDTARALGGQANRIEFAATDAYYNTKPQALEVTVDMDEREKAGPDNTLAQQLLDEGKIRALLNSAALAHVKKVVDTVLAAVSAEANRGNWSNNDVDPIDQLDEQIDALSKAVGSTQNIYISMDVGAWRALRLNAKVKARVTGAQATPITRQQLVDSLVIPVNLGIYGLSYNTKALGQTAVKARLLASEALVHYSLPSPTEYDPSAFKCFSMNRSLVTSVRTYTDVSERFDVHAVDWSVDIKQTSTIAMKRLSIT